MPGPYVGWANKVMADSPKFQFAEESRSPTLLPCLQIVSSLIYSYWLVLFLAGKDPCFTKNVHDVKKLQNDWTMWDQSSGLKSPAIICRCLSVTHIYAIYFTSSPSLHRIFWNNLSSVVCRMVLVFARVWFLFGHSHSSVTAAPELLF